MTNIEYHKPEDLNGLSTLLERFASGLTIIAGGTNLLPDMRHGAVSPSVLVDIGELDALRDISLEGDRINIGAATTIGRIATDPLIKAHCPILSAAAAKLGNPLTRNRATIGGNLANASPCADTAPPLLALDASAEIMDVRGQTRRVSLDRFFMGYKWTDLKPGEVLTRISVPKPSAGMNGGHTKLGIRKAAAICVASVAVMLEKSGDRVKHIRIAFGSVAPKPLRAYRLEAFIQDQRVDDSVLSRCEPLLQQEISPISDIRGTENYRRHVTAVIFKRHMQQLCA